MIFFTKSFSTQTFMFSNTIIQSSQDVSSCNNNVITGNNKDICGNNNIVNGNNCDIVGNNNIVNGNNCDATGNNNKLYGQNCSTKGRNNLINNVDPTKNEQKQFTDNNCFRTISIGDMNITSSPNSGIISNIGSNGSGISNNFVNTFGLCTVGSCGRRVNTKGSLIMINNHAQYTGETTIMTGKNKTFERIDEKSIRLIPADTQSWETEANVTLDNITVSGETSQWNKIMNNPNTGIISIREGKLVVVDKLAS